MGKRSRQESSSSLKSIDSARQNGKEEPASKRRSLSDRTSSRLTSTSSTSTISSLQSLNYDNVNRSGKIIQMTLKNFMCHSNLLVDFNNRVNLLVGNNGSGKSAILTAIIIGLGSKSAATNRCQNMKQLIKNGQNSASIEIQIHNYESDGYEYDKYGDKIIVLRSFTAAGASTYKLKNSDGQLVSTSREDLMRILMYLNIQVDNPVCVLNQDASRSFLRESDPKKRYQLFLKATQIETIMEKLQECHFHFKNAKVQLDYHRKRSNLMQTTVQELYEKLEQMRSVATIKEKVAALKMEQAWLFVIDQEIFTDEIQKALTEFQQTYDALKVTCSSKDAMQQQIRENSEKFRAEQELLRQHLLQDEERFTEQRSALAEKKAIHHQMQQNVQKLVNKCNRLQTDIVQLNSDISELSQAGSNAVQIQRENDAISKQNLTKELADKSAMSANAERDITMMINTKYEMTANFNGLREEKQNLLRGTDKLNEQIRRCDVSTKDTLLVYGEYMPRLRASIEALYKKGAFSEMPRGPIGHYIKITDERWKIPIEGITNGVIQNFLVADSKDRRLLQELIRKEYPQHLRHAVISCKFQHTVYNVSRGRVQPVANSRLAMDLIHCDDPVVMNCLIDQCKVERILLVEDESQAVKLTAEEENVPRNLLRVVLREPLSDFYPAPNYRSYSNPQRYAKFLQVNMEQRKKDLYDELQNLNNRKNAIEKQLAASQDKITQIAKTLNEKTEQKDRHEMDLQRIKSKLADLNAIEYPDGNGMEMLNKELDQLTQTFEETQEAYVVEKQRIQEHAQLLAEKDRELEEIKKIVDEKEMQMRDLQYQHEQKQRKITELVVNAEHSAAQIKTMEKDMQKLKKEYDDAMTKLGRLVAVAENRGERMVPRHTHEQITVKLSKNERLIRAVPSTEPIETVEMKYCRKSKEHEQLQAMIEALVETLTLLQKSRHSRIDRLRNLKQHMSLRVKSRFNEILKLRNYSGDITIDFDTLRLELSIVPRDKDVANAVSQASGLSGGERSYSTVAFLLSLWSCVDFPFYFLDEYDVFTDQINRHYITKLLLSEADKKVHRQYTFLTPQDMSDISGTNTLSVHRLADPER